MRYTSCTVVEDWCLLELLAVLLDRPSIKDVLHSVEKQTDCCVQRRTKQDCLRRLVWIVLKSCVNFKPESSGLRLIVAVHRPTLQGRAYNTHCVVRLHFPRKGNQRSLSSLRALRSIVNLGPWSAKQPPWVKPGRISQDRRRRTREDLTIFPHLPGEGC